MYLVLVFGIVIPSSFHVEFKLPLPWPTCGLSAVNSNILAVAGGSANRELCPYQPHDPGIPTEVV